MSKNTTPAAPSHDEIARHAYYAWEQDGRPHGRHTQYWLAAEAALRVKANAKAPALGAATAREISPKAATTTPTNGHRTATPKVAKPAVPAAGAKPARSVKPSAPRRKG